MINPDALDEVIKNLAFEFFLWFSRFEFALKENGKVRAGPHGIAQPDWNAFVSDHERAYVLTEEAGELIGSPPDVQRFRGGGTWEWSPLTFTPGQSELSKLVLIVKTVRNNLFHGGKHTSAGWDDPARVQFLLNRSLAAVDSFAHLAGYEADYKRRY